MSSSISIYIIIIIVIYSSSRAWATLPRQGLARKGDLGPTYLHYERHRNRTCPAGLFGAAEQKARGSKKDPDAIILRSKHLARQDSLISAAHKARNYKPKLGIVVATPPECVRPLSFSRAALGYDSGGVVVVVTTIAPDGSSYHTVGYHLAMARPDELDRLLRPNPRAPRIACWAKPMVLRSARCPGANASVGCAVDGVGEDRVLKGDVVGYNGGGQVVAHPLEKAKHAVEVVAGILGDHLHEAHRPSIRQGGGEEREYMCEWPFGGAAAAAAARIYCYLKRAKHFGRDQLKVVL